MAEQLSIENIVFENARKCHENYLLKNQEHDLQEAIESYVEVLSLNPQHAQCYYRLASLMYESGQITLESTIEQCKKAININPKNHNAYIYAGYYLEQAKNYSDAEKTFKNAINLHSFNSARARLILASTIKKKLEQQGVNITDAIKVLYYFVTGSLSLFVDFSTLKMFYKNFFDNIFFAGCKFVGKFLEKFDSDFVIDFYNFAIQKTNRNDYFYDRKAQFYLKNSNVDLAIETYKNFLQLESNNKNILIELANLTQIYYPENVDEIIDYYTAALELEDDDLSSIYYELGYLYLKKGDKVNAVAAFKLALCENEDNPYYNEALAYAYVQAELFDDAIEFYQRAIKLNPDRMWTVNVCYTLGLIYQKCKENYEAAIASFQAGTILDSKNEQLLLALADVYAIQNETESAIKSYEDVIAINPNNYEAYSKLGIVFWDKRYIDEAMKAYQRALDINPLHEITYNNLGVVYLEEIKDYTFAMECFDKAIKLNPNYTYAYFNKARVLQEIGKYSDAALTYQMALDLNRITRVLDEEEIQKRIMELFEI